MPGAQHRTATSREGMERRLKKGWETGAEEEGAQRKSMARLRMETWQTGPTLLGPDTHPKPEQIEQKREGREERSLGELGL